MTRRVLDLFCGAGGASWGYFLAMHDAEIVGVDHVAQPRYPFTFHQADAMRYPLEGFDIIHASPPCQRYSDLARTNPNPGKWPDYIAALRSRLRRSGAVYVIENVEGAPLRAPVLLCGTMFPGLRVIRHRLFECNVALGDPPPHVIPHPRVYSLDKRKKSFGRLDPMTSLVTVTGGGNASAANKRDAMGITWMRHRELNEAIPPPYTQWVGGRLLEAMQ